MIATETMIELDIRKYTGGVTSKETYAIYKSMRNWLKENKVDHMFVWADTGYYNPSSVMLEKESATMFRLVFDV